MDTVHKIGRRKTAVARIYLSEGKGNITVTKKIIKTTLQQVLYNIKFNNL